MTDKNIYFGSNKDSNKENIAKENKTNTVSTYQSTVYIPGKTDFSIDNTKTIYVPQGSVPVTKTITIKPKVTPQVVEPKKVEPKKVIRRTPEEILKILLSKRYLRNVIKRSNSRNIYLKKFKRPEIVKPKITTDFVLFIIDTNKEMFEDIMLVNKRIEYILKDFSDNTLFYLVFTDSDYSGNKILKKQDFIASLPTCTLGNNETRLYDTIVSINKSKMMKHVDSIVNIDNTDYVIENSKIIYLGSGFDKNSESTLQEAMENFIYLSIAYDTKAFVFNDVDMVRLASIGFREIKHVVKK